MSKALIFLLASLTVSTAKYSDCGSIAGQVSNVALVGCDMTQDVCVLKRGTDAAITIDFKSLEAATSVNAVVHGVIGGFPMPFPLPQSDACQKSGLTCPLVNGNPYTYTQNLSVLTSYPAIDVTVKWELVGQDSKDIVCIEIPAKLE